MAEMNINGWGIQVIGDGDSDSATYLPCSTEYAVRVARLTPRLVRVSWGKQYQLVVGGRLVVTDGRAHSDLPEYTPEMFPVPLDEWYSGNCGVTVAQLRDGKMKPVGEVRAQTLLFHACSVEAVREFLTKGTK